MLNKVHRRHVFILSTSETKWGRFKNYTASTIAYYHNLVHPKCYTVL